jgi:hypothetical protein
VLWTFDFQSALDHGANCQSSGLRVRRLHRDRQLRRRRPGRGRHRARGRRLPGQPRRHADARPRATPVVDPIPVDNCSKNEGGPPTVADFDGDGVPRSGSPGPTTTWSMDLECLADPAASAVLQRPRHPLEGHQRRLLVARDGLERVRLRRRREGRGRLQRRADFSVFDGTTGATVLRDREPLSHPPRDADRRRRRQRRETPRSSSPRTRMAGRGKGIRVYGDASRLVGAHAPHLEPAQLPRDQRRPSSAASPLPKPIELARADDLDARRRDEQLPAEPPGRSTSSPRRTSPWSSPSARPPAPRR